MKYDNTVTRSMNVLQVP